MIKQHGSRTFLFSAAKVASAWVGVAHYVLFPIVLILLGIFSVPAHSQDLPLIVSDVEVTERNGQTYIDITSTQKLTLKPFFLGNPPRLILDHEDVLFSITTPPAGAGAITGYRFGQLNGRVARFVFDLSGPSDLISEKQTVSADGQHVTRLVIASVSQGAFQKAQALFRKYLPTQNAESADDADQNNAAPELGEHEKNALMERARAKGDKREDKLRIVIDAGHGGIDPGALGRGNILEKNLTLNYAKKIAQALEDAGFETLLTREDDRFVSLSDRVRFTELADADLFLSIHADSFGNSPLRGVRDSVRGASIYTFSLEASNAETAAYAERENASDVLAGVEQQSVLHNDAALVSGILGDLKRREKRKLTEDFAILLHASLNDTLIFHKRPRKRARFKVLSAELVPSVLLEIGYLSSNNDVQVLTQPETIDATARAVRTAVESYQRRMASF